MSLSYKFLLPLLVTLFALNVVLGGITYSPSTYEPSYTLFDHHIDVVGDVNQYSVSTLPYKRNNDSTAQCNGIVKEKNQSTTLFTAPCQTSSKKHNQLFQVTCLQKKGQYVDVAFLKNGTSYLEVVGENVHAAFVVQPYSGESQKQLWLPHGTYETEYEGVGVNVTCKGRV